MILLLLLCGFYAEATHIKGGNISGKVVSISPVTILFTVTLYRNGNSPVPIGGGTLDFWDGTTVQLVSAADSSEVIDYGENIEEHRFYISHTYSNNSKLVTVNYFEGNRNGGTVNMAESVNTPFSMSTTLQITPGGRINNSPIFLIPAIDNGVVGQIFQHNVGAFDPDGDSLSYELIVPEQQHNNKVRGYFLPDTTYIDEFGTIIWDKPESPGQYTFALRVIEWRKNDWEYVEVGSVMRDIQIFIGTEPNLAPTISPGGELCITAGDTLSIPIVAEDPNGDNLRMVVFGDVFATDSEITLEPDSSSYHPTPLNATLTWNTTCNDVRNSTYLIYIRVSDDYGDPELSSYTVWKVRVLGPPPVPAIAQETGDRNVKLSWHEYCSPLPKIRIHRRVGSFAYSPEECSSGVPDMLGYEIIAEIAGGNEFNDFDLARGANYCYRLTAIWPDGAESTVSEEVCFLVPVATPVITKASVTRTDAMNGEVALIWTSSFDLQGVTENIGYRVEAMTGADGQLQTLSPFMTDTTFVHTNANTYDNEIHYRILLLQANAVIDSSTWAAPPKLTGDAEFSSISLQWQAEVPWSNRTLRYPMHYIFRSRSNSNDPEQFNLIDSTDVNLNGFSYKDNSVDNQGEYRYRIQTVGSYDNPKLPEPLRNNSQDISIFLRDSIPPCPPVISILNASETDCFNMISELGCDGSVLFNSIFIQPSCADEDLAYYKLYYSPSNSQDSMTLLARLDQQVFEHQGLESVAGCYYAVAVDFSGNVSLPSEIACRNNCFYIEFPNIITPNNDGLNDALKGANISENKAFCASFAGNTVVSVINRYGKEIHHAEFEQLNLDEVLWDGTNSNGQLVAPGTYFYEIGINVNDLINYESRHKGWIDVRY